MTSLRDISRAERDASFRRMEARRLQANREDAPLLARNLSIDLDEMEPSILKEIRKEARAERIRLSSRDRLANREAAKDRPHKK